MKIQPPASPHKVHEGTVSSYLKSTTCLHFLTPSFILPSINIVAI